MLEKTKKKKKSGARFFFPLINNPHQGATFVTNDESTLTRHHHLESTDYRAQSGALKGF